MGSHNASRDIWLTGNHCEPIRWRKKARVYIIKAAPNRMVYMVYMYTWSESLLELL